MPCVVMVSSEFFRGVGCSDYGRPSE